MATNLIAFPFRLSADGAVATLEQGSDDQLCNELAVLAMTRPEERELVPDFGLEDPTYDNFDAAEFTTKVLLYGPAVRINSIKASWPSSSLQRIYIEFDSLADSEAPPSYDDFTADQTFTTTGTLEFSDDLS